MTAIAATAPAIKAGAHAFDSDQAPAIACSIAVSAALALARPDRRPAPCRDGRVHNTNHKRVPQFGIELLNMSLRSEAAF